MHLDVNNLNNFYTKSVLGQFAKKRLRESVRKLWGSQLSGQVAGYGFSPPVLSLFLNHPRQILCLMPGQQGVMPWPTREKNCSVLVEETSWPIGTESIDRLIVLHGLETSEKLKDLFQEIWRVLAPTARVIFVVPNRSGWWARSESTPFGQGRPYSIKQLNNQLKLNRFRVEKYLTVLHAPPIEKLHALKIAPFFENVGNRFYSRIGAGIILLEASKQIYALNGPLQFNEVTTPIDALEELADPKAV